jgi:hypothetical protein
MFIVCIYKACRIDNFFPGDKVARSLYLVALFIRNRFKLERNCPMGFAMAENIY